jgi:hypothetical protein
MSIGTTKISEQIQEIIEQQKDKGKLKEITATIQGIEKAKIEDLLTL